MGRCSNAANLPENVVIAHSWWRKLGSRQPKLHTYRPAPLIALLRFALFCPLSHTCAFWRPIIVALLFPMQLNSEHHSPYDSQIEKSESKRGLASFSHPDGGPSLNPQPTTASTSDKTEQYRSYNIREWPVSERPREKCMTHGPKALSDAELLAILFRTGTRGATAVDLAKQSLQHFDGLKNLFDSNLEEFSRIKGLGASKHIQLKAVIELGRRYIGEQSFAPKELDSSEAVKSYCRLALSHASSEIFAVLFLDSQYRLLRYEELFHGTIDSAAVYPREVVKKALAYNASAVILSHNHPSGVAEPSQADIEITQRLKEALGLVDIKTIDHIVVGRSEAVSFAERGLL